MSSASLFSDPARLIERLSHINWSNNPSSVSLVSPREANESRFGAPTNITCYKRPMRPNDYAPRPAHLKWLLDSDPAIRWQVMRDLTDQAAGAIAAERSRVATEGWG